MKSFLKLIKENPNRGALGAGTAYAVLLMLILGGGAVMMIGNIAPKVHVPYNGQSVIISPPVQDTSAKSLQLNTFGGALVTLTPRPTLDPIPDFAENKKASNSAGTRQKLNITAK